MSSISLKRPATHFFQITTVRSFLRQCRTRQCDDAAEVSGDFHIALVRRLTGCSLRLGPSNQSNETAPTATTSKGRPHHVSPGLRHLPSPDQTALLNALV